MVTSASKTRRRRNAETYGGDVELWIRAQEADPNAFGDLFDRHADAVYRYGYVRTGEPGAAEEIVSVVFSEAWRQRDRIELTDGSLRPWLIAVARNQSNRYHRQRIRDGQRSVLGDPFIEDHAQRVAEAADAPDELSAVLRAIEGLPSAARETLVLHVWGGLTHEQIATELGVSTGTVKSRLNRARSRLGARGNPQRPPSVIDLHGDVTGADEDA